MRRHQEVGSNNQVLGQVKANVDRVGTVRQQLVTEAAKAAAQVEHQRTLNGRQQFRH